MASLIGRFTPVLLAAADEELRADPTLGGKLVLECDGRIMVSYAPFDHVQESARVVIVGITPGAQQASNALLAARHKLRERADEACALASAKVFASFSGPMRSNLIEMLDYVGVNRWLGLQTTATLWNTDQHLVTSALRYPVFIGGRNYSGQPSMTATPVLRKLLDLYLQEEAIALKGALWIPLGPKATEGITWLIQKGVIPAERVLDGLPHPSGANAERIAYFVGRKRREALSVKTDPRGLDDSRARIIALVDLLSAASV